MGRRVLTVSELTFHRKFKRNPASFAPADLDGEDLLDIFETWAKSLNTSDTHNEERQTWVSVAAVVRYAPRVIMLDLRVGAYGEPGDLVDISTGSPVGQIEDHQAPTGENRAMLFVPERGERAHFLSEESSRGSAGGRILSLFKKHFSQYTDQITMVTAPVTEGEAWREAAMLTEVEVRLLARARTSRTASRSKLAGCHTSHGRRGAGSFRASSSGNCTTQAWRRRWLQSTSCPRTTTSS